MRDALVWSLPAIAAGLVVRMALILSQPLAYWGSDSSSYFWFAQRLLTEGAISLPAKRHLLYPIVLVPATILPGPLLAILAPLQHALGLATVAAVGYCTRKLFLGWKLWIIPCTAAFALMPALVWYEHELLGEALFAHALAWAFAGWLAWDARGRVASAWWLFLVPFAVCVLTKSAGRLFWPGIFLGLVVTRAWRHLRWPQWLATAALLVVSWTMGDGSQGSRLLYTSAFPLTVLDTPSHAPLKHEIAPLVSAERAEILTYHLDDSGPKEFLRKGHRDEDRYPAWRALARDEAALWAAAKSLAFEGIRSAPAEFLGIALRRTGTSLDLTAFKTDRFHADYFPGRFREHYEALMDERNGPAALALLLGEPVPAYNDLSSQFARSWQVDLGRSLHWIAETYAVAFTPVRAGEDGRVTLTPTGWWLLLALAISLFPKYLPRAGVWMAVVLGYALAVHMLGSANPRFVVPVWAVLCVVVALPADCLCNAWLGKNSRALVKS